MDTHPLYCMHCADVHDLTLTEIFRVVATLQYNPAMCADITTARGPACLLTVVAYATQMAAA